MQSRPARFAWLLASASVLWLDGCGRSTADHSAAVTELGVEPDRVEAPRCAPDAFTYAPAPVTIDGLPTVPIDILALDARLEFDLASESASASATLRFQLGEVGGMPWFDLRQQPTSLLLDGKALAVDQLAAHDFGVGLESGFTILAVELGPCSVHTLTLETPLSTPRAAGAEPPSFSAGSELRFDLGASDLEPGRYLESWLPANMPWDRYPITLEVGLAHAPTDHRLISNASVEVLGPHRWALEFPATTTAMDPMLTIAPAESLTRLIGVHAAANGQSIPYAIHVDTDVSLSAEQVAERVTATLDRYVVELGPYPHPSLTIHVHARGGSMEYAGATVTTLQALDHELFHSWWARGLSPARYADGWIDEAWAMHHAGPHVDAQQPRALVWTNDRTRLYDPHPFARDTPQIAYANGRLLFAGFAEILGPEPLQAAMAELYRTRGPIASITTAELEHQLVCAGTEPSQQIAVRRAFHRFVHGREGEPDPADAPTCPGPATPPAAPGMPLSPD